MSLSSLINYLLTHNELIIQWLIVLIIALVVLLVGRSLFKKPKIQKLVSTSAETSHSTEHVEELLNKILEKTAKWDQAAPPIKTNGSSAPSSSVNSEELEIAKKELTQLKNELQAKEAEIKKIKSSPPVSIDSESGTVSETGGSTREYLEKIADLESKLSEYEVLEDDIADLSLYKEENARLKSEVERLKGGGEDLEGSSTSIPEPDNSEDLVREFAEAVGKEPTQSDDEVAAEEEISPLVAEADEEPEAPAEVAAAPEPTEASPTAPEPAAPSQAAPQSMVDDLFAELASSDLDTDKVVSELAEIESMAVATTSEEALSEDLDPDKIAQEADELES